MLTVLPMTRILSAYVWLNGPWYRSGALTGQYEHRSHGIGQNAPTDRGASLIVSSKLRAKLGVDQPTGGRYVASDFEDLFEDDLNRDRRVCVSAVYADHRGLGVSVLNEGGPLV